MVRHKITIATDGSGNFDSSTEQACVGEIFDIQYVVGGTALDNTADFTITGAVTGKSILTVTNVAAAFTHPVRVAVVDQSAAARLYAAGGTAVSDRIAVSEPVRLQIAQGGASKNGTLYITVG